MASMATGCTCTNDTAETMLRQLSATDVAPTMWPCGGRGRRTPRPEGRSPRRRGKCPLVPTVAFALVVIVTFIFIGIFIGDRVYSREARPLGTPHAPDEGARLRVLGAAPDTPGDCGSTVTSGATQHGSLALDLGHSNVSHCEVTLQVTSGRYLFVRLENVTLCPGGAVQVHIYHRGRQYGVLHANTSLAASRFVHSLGPRVLVAWEGPPCRTTHAALRYNAFTQVSGAEQQCPGGEFRCDCGWCVAGHHQCDGRQNCEDNSDEVYCRGRTRHLLHPGVHHGQQLSILFGVWTSLVFVVVACVAVHRAKARAAALARCGPDTGAVPGGSGGGGQLVGSITVHTGRGTHHWTILPSSDTEMRDMRAARRDPPPAYEDLTTPQSHRPEATREPPPYGDGPGEEGAPPHYDEVVRAATQGDRGGAGTGGDTASTETSADQNR